MTRWTTWVALLRGINVGKAKRVAMADLRALVESLGYADVRTLLNSGNVVFEGAAGNPLTVAARLEAALVERLAVESRIVVLTAAELASALDANPLDAPDDPARFLIACFVDANAAERAHPLAAQRWDPDRFAVAGRVAWLSCATGLLKSPLVKAFGRAAGDTATTRNWTTMTKLRVLAGS